MPFNLKTYFFSTILREQLPYRTDSQEKVVPITTMLTCSQLGLNLTFLSPFDLYRLPPSVTLYLNGTFVQGETYCIYIYIKNTNFRISLKVTKIYLMKAGVQNSRNAITTKMRKFRLKYHANTSCAGCSFSYINRNATL